MREEGEDRLLTIIESEQAAWSNREVRLLAATKKWG